MRLITKFKKAGLLASLMATLLTTSSLTLAAGTIDCSNIITKRDTLISKIANRVTQSPPSRFACGNEQGAGAAWRNKITSISNSSQVASAWTTFNNAVQTQLRQAQKTCKDSSHNTVREAGLNSYVETALQVACDKGYYSITGPSSGGGTIDCTEIFNKCKTFTQAVNNKIKNSPANTAQCVPSSTAWLNKINSTQNFSQVASAWNSFNNQVQTQLRQAKKTCNNASHNKVREVVLGIEITKALDTQCDTGQITSPQICK